MWPTVRRGVAVYAISFTVSTVLHEWPRNLKLEIYNKMDVFTPHYLNNTNDPKRHNIIWGALTAGFSTMRSQSCARVQCYYRHVVPYLFLYMMLLEQLSLSVHALNFLPNNKMVYVVHSGGTASPHYVASLALTVLYVNLLLLAAEGTF